MTDPASLTARAGRATVGSLFRDRAASHPAAPALQDGDRLLSYGALNERVNRTAALFVGHGLRSGDRVALLAENRAEYLEIKLAAAKLGLIVACQNWRLAPAELQHCMDLVEPALVVTSPRHAGTLALLDLRGRPALTLGDDWEAALARASAAEPDVDVDPESPLVIIYTSGTTGLPKGAAISHRAEIARALVLHVDMPVRPGDDTYVAWSPLYHMGGSDQSLATLMSGGKVITVDGFDLPALLRTLREERLGWLILLPGMIDRVIDALHREKPSPRVGCCGAMADLVPAHQLAEVTRLLGAPYVNTFGATETGTPPCSAGLLLPGEAPASLAKRRSSFVELRLVDEDDNDVPDGTPGEMALRGPTLFSGYWRNDAANARDFRGGWFHMGDVFVRQADGLYNFVDRAKYMIKSGGENIYPAEIERVLLAHDLVADAAVVRRPDDRWGEVPVAFVARRDRSLQPDALYAACRQALAGYKQPKDIRFIRPDAFPRNPTGKILRHEMEAWLKAGDVPGED